MKIPQANLPKIAILRGGTYKRELSLEEGEVLLMSLSQIGYEPLDILIDEDGSWVHKGMPTDAHAVFTTADAYVDVTYSKKEEYHNLAKRMQIPNLLHDHDMPHEYDQETLYRLLRQKGIAVPETSCVRSHKDVDEQHLYELWRSMHTPLLVRSLTRGTKEPSKLVRSLIDLKDVVRSFFEKKQDVHVMTYKETPVYSIAVLPSYRGEAWYTPFPVFSSPEKNTIPHSAMSTYPYSDGSPEERAHIVALGAQVAEALNVQAPVCVDIIHDKNKFTVVNVALRPSLRRDGRFMQSLATTGVDLGHYLHTKIFV